MLQIMASIYLSSSRMWTVRVRELYKLRPTVKATTGRGFKTDTNLNFLRRQTKEERVLEEYPKQAQSKRFSKYPVSSVIKKGRSLVGDQSFKNFKILVEISDQGVVVGATTFWLGAISCYGFGLLDALINSMPNFHEFPEYVKNRLLQAYAWRYYSGGSCVVSGLTSAAVCQRPVLVSCLTRSQALASNCPFPSLLLTDTAVM